ncbi:MAG: hypothetical protein OCD02_14275 [Spirochaetaceae bacterium]
MKYFFLSLLVLLSVNIFSNDSFVEIYKTHDNGLYARSEDRDIILTVKDSTFKRYQTLPADPMLDFLTAVVLRTEVVDKLDSLLENRDQVQLGFVKISKEGSIYTVDDDNLFLSFSFSVEKPNMDVIKIIENHYKLLPQIGKSVTEHYNNNYIIRIHSAENILKPEAKEITYDEALLMATIIGDDEQWLWGIHDGSDYLATLLLD